MGKQGAQEAKLEAAIEEMAVMKRSQPSVEIKRDAKGQISYTVKVYNDDPEKAREMALTEIEALDEHFKVE